MGRHEEVQLPRSDISSPIPDDALSDAFDPETGAERDVAWGGDGAGRGHTASAISMHGHLGILHFSPIRESLPWPMPLAAAAGPGIVR